MNTQIDEAEQWEVEREMSRLVEAISSHITEAQLQEMRAKKFREEAEKLNQTLNLCRQRLGLPLIAVREDSAKTAERLSRTTPEGRMCASVSPHVHRGG